MQSDEQIVQAPQVSIIMNCFNSERYLKEAIDSIYSQTHNDWEIIFWDNASSDGSAAIAQSYDGRLKYFKSDNNVMLGKARNWAIEKARGKYIAFLDCDDIWLPTKLKQQVEIAENNDDIDFVYSNYFVRDMQSNEQVIALQGAYPHGTVFESFLCYYPVAILTVLLTKRSLESFGIVFDEKLGWAEEYDVFMRVLYRSQAAYIEEPLAIYRKHPEMCTKKYNRDTQIDEINCVIDKLKNMDVNFEVKYADALRMKDKNNAYLSARISIDTHDFIKARKYLGPYKYINLKYCILYHSLYVPMLWKLFLPIVKKAGKFRNKRYNQSLCM